MIGSITQVQQEMGLGKSTMPKPDQHAVEWAKRILADGYQAPPFDANDAERILRAAGLNPDDYHADRVPDSAPPGARAVAAAIRDLDQDGPDCPKSYQGRGVTAGPGAPLEPHRPSEPGVFDRPYIGAGHGAESPQADPPRQNPQPAWPRGVQVPIQLGDVPAIGRVTADIAQALSMGSPSDR